MTDLLPAIHESWFSDASCNVLANLVVEVDDVEGLIVEIGAWEGRSTIAMAVAACPRMVHTVDTWAGSPGEVSMTLATQRDVFAQWQTNVDHWTQGNVESHRMGWREYVAGLLYLGEPVALAFIDAEHSYTEVHAAITALRPLMSPGGVVCGDDVHDPGVHRAALEQFPDGDQRCTLWIGRL